ncbi:hypothetical protein B0T19DRAFT_405198 [Cercophora scortea]|uniref:Uncharacterized protein n=1 Tax=Cercophora scortea TaxID=314031 RepID=A0AAE0M324_9PEZI|nr:hypothetical protein B0T19DRAFT_405198 [Cercophora scortea]
MKTTILPALSVLAFFTGSSTAFWGQLRLDYSCPGEGCFTTLNIKDYNTGSTYTCGAVNPSYCTSEGKCPVYCQETSPGGYNWNAQFWQTTDGCDNMDFLGAFGGAGHGYCCGGAPCDIGA